MTDKQTQIANWLMNRAKKFACVKDDTGADSELPVENPYANSLENLPDEDDGSYIRSGNQRPGLIFSIYDTFD